MSAERKRRLELGLRGNRGRQIRSEWLAAMREASHLEITEEALLPLEETEELKKAFFTVLKERASYHEYWPETGLAAIAALLADLGREVGPLPVILFSSVDEYIGALRIPADAVLANSLSIWEVVKEDITCATNDLEHGLYLEFNAYAEIQEQLLRNVYELTAWGVLAPKSNGTDPIPRL